MVARKSGAADTPSTAVVVNRDERRHLIEDCAYFRAARFREVEAGNVREQDLRAAAAVVDTVIKPRRKRRKGH